MLTISLVFSPVGKDGSISAKRPNTAVSEELLKEISSWRDEGATDKDVLTRLRLRTVPEGYTYHSWNPGRWILLPVLFSFDFPVMF